MFVAQFDGDAGGLLLKGAGRLIALELGKHGLTPEHGFIGHGEVLIFAPKMAAQVGATKMVRWECIAVNPHDRGTYSTLTNTSKQGEEKMPFKASNPRPYSVYGQFFAEMRWTRPRRGLSPRRFMHCAATRWRSEPRYAEHQGRQNPLQPEWAVFRPGRPPVDLYLGQVQQQTQLCRPWQEPDAVSGEIHRVMVGPKLCEQTGITFTPVYRMMLVNLQHS